MVFRLDDAFCRENGLSLNNSCCLSFSIFNRLLKSAAQMTTAERRRRSWGGSALGKIAVTSLAQDEKESIHKSSAIEKAQMVIPLQNGEDKSSDASQTYHTIIVQIAMLNMYSTVCSAQDLIYVLSFYIGAFVGMRGGLSL